MDMRWRSAFSRRRGLARVVLAVREVLQAWSDDMGATLSAAIAFFTAFSLAPVLVVAISIASLFFGEEAVEGRLFSGIQAVIGADSAVVLQAMVASAWKAGAGGWTGWLSVGAVLLGASATFAQLNGALNIIWHAPPPVHALASLVRVRLISFGLVVGTGFLIVVLLVFDAIILYSSERLLGRWHLDALLHYVEQGISFVCLIVAFTVLLKVLPDVHVRWRAARGGGLAAAILFSAGKQLFARYLAYAGTANAFGAAGALAVLMMWLYFSAAVFLLGGQIVAFLSRPGPPSRARPPS